jgi:hypothetical protein
VEAAGTAQQTRPAPGFGDHVVGGAADDPVGQAAAAAVHLRAAALLGVDVPAW